jgi:hypothetical protein
LKIRFQADADLRRPIVTALKRREPAIDFRTAQEAGLTGLDDLTVLGIAAEDGRVLVSHDVSTMPESFSLFIQTRTSPGTILISQQMSYREAVEGLLRVWEHTDAEDWRNVLSFLPR